MAVVNGTNAGFVSSTPSANPSGGQESWGGLLYANKHASPASAFNVIGMGFYQSYGSITSTNYEMGIYSHDAANDKPNALQGSKATGQTTGTTEGWKNYTGLSITGLLTSTTYWQAVQADDVASDPGCDRSSEAGARRSRASGHTEIPTSWPSSTQTADENFAIYALYEAAAVTLSPNNGAHANPVSIPTVTQTQVSAPAALAHANPVTVATLLQTHVIAPAATAHANLVSVGTLLQTHLISPAAGVFGSAVSVPTVNQTHQVSPDSGVSAGIAGEPSVEATTVITAESCAHTVQSGRKDYVKLANGDYLLNAAGDRIPLNYYGDVEVVAEAETITVFPDACAHGSTLGEPALEQTHIVAADSLSIGSVAGTAAIVQTHILSPAESVHGCSTESPTVEQSFTVVADSCANSSSVGVATLLQTHVIGPVDCVHQQSCAEPVVGAISVLTADSSVVASIVDAATLLQTHVIAPAMSNHASVANAATILQTHIMEPSAIVHASECTEPLIGSVTVIDADDATCSVQDNAGGYLMMADGSGYVLNAAGDKIPLMYGYVRQTNILSPDACVHATRSDEASLSLAVTTVDPDDLVHQLSDNSRQAVLDQAGNPVLDEAGNPVEIQIWGANITQTHVVAANSTAHGNASTSPDILSYTVADSATHANPVSVATILQTHVVSPEACAVTGSMSAAGILQTHAINPDSEIHAGQVNGATLAQTHVITPEAGALAGSVSVAGILQTHAINPDSEVHAGAAGVAEIIQTHMVTPAECMHSQAASQPIIGAISVLEADDSVVASSVGVPEVVQSSEISPQASAVSTSVSVAEIIQTHMVTPAESVHQQAATQPVVGAMSVVEADDSVIAHSVGVPTIIQTHQILPESSAISSSVSSATLVQTHIIIPIEGINICITGEAIVVQGGVIAPDAAVHAQTSGEPTVESTGIVIPVSAVHGSQAGAASIVQTHVVSPVGSWHAGRLTEPIISLVEAGGFRSLLCTDMSIFFNLEEFAETVTYTASGQAGVNITAIIIRDTAYQEPYVRGKKTAHADLYVKKNEIAEPRHGDVFTADEEVWELDPLRGMFYEDDCMMVVGLERRFT